MLPLDDRFRERVADPTRPLASQQRDLYRYFPGTSPVPNQALPLTLNCRHSFTARLALNRADDQGFLVGQGSELSGWALFVQDGHGVYVNNCVKLHVSEVRTSVALPVGREFSLGYEYEPVDIGVGSVRLLVDGQVVAIGERVPAAPMGYSNSIEGLQVGRCWSTPITYAHFRDSFPFTGSLLVVELRSDPASQLRRTNYADPGDAKPQPSAVKRE